MTPLVSYQRLGGRGVGQDERLEVDADGSFRAWRSVSERRAGAFGGTLAASDLDELTALANDAVAVEPIRSQQRVEGGAVERVAVRETALTLADATDPGVAWTALLRRVRELVLRSVDHPVAALEASTDAAASVLAVEAIGSAPIEADVSGGTVRVTARLATGNATWEEDVFDLVDDDDSFVDPLDEDSEGALRREPGWRLEIPLAHGLDVGGATAAAVTLQGWIKAEDASATYEITVPLKGTTVGG